MKAVVYHADSHFAWQEPVENLYGELFKIYVRMCHHFNMRVIHLTLDGFEGWGDENHFYKGFDPHDVMYNREKIYYEFLKSAPDDVYWFSEPDIEVFKMWPPLTTDACFLYREDPVPMNPAWRMVTPKALPIFKEFSETIETVETGPGVGRDWHCDSVCMAKVWRNMGKPKVGFHSYLGCTTEFRDYELYIKPKNVYSRNHTAKRKLKYVKEAGGRW